MKINWSLTKIIFLFCLTLSSLFAQDKGIYLDNTMISIPASGESSTGTLNFITPCSDFNVNSGKVWVKIDMGENYELGYDNFGVPFEITMDLDIKLDTNSSRFDPEISFTVALNNNKPESVVFLDLSQYIDNDNNASGLSYLGYRINTVEATLRNISNTSVTFDASTALNVTLNYEVAYGIDVSSNVVTNLSATPITNSKSYIFSWDDSCDAPGYEFQIIRLYNTDPSTSNNQQIITTAIDWEKALSLHIDSSTTSIDLTMAEGQGYYAWRVRPIGTLYKNGIGNSKNWGSWNALDYTQCNSCTFTPDTNSTQVFFFTDWDDQKNYQFSRVFTENNKISEQITYATSLNQVKQTQRYLPSKDYKVITQTILDYSGRPTLSTLPIPINGEKLNNYKEEFVTNEGRLYKAEDFDRSGNYKNPKVIDATGAFTYYSSVNIDKRIPDAEGYPFTRTIFSNDGTDRVVEQSGVGKTHMIGDQGNGSGRTTRTLYSTPTEDELVKLFGDEAPNHQDVAKIITIDPNNTKSVSFITKEGNTIATGLTFSEDDDVLDSVKGSDPNNIINGIKDRITNNIKTSDGFMAAKRITILEDGTDINISYTIARKKLEGLCHNFDVDIDYSLKIEIFDVNTGAVIHTFEQPTLSVLADTTDDSIDNVTKDFGTVTLDTGTYYVQKTLLPSDDVKLRIVDAGDAMKRLIEPFFNWILDFSSRVDCKEEMDFLYHDIFHFGQLVYNRQLASNISVSPEGIRESIISFNCVDCSQETTKFIAKDPNDPEADDEFLDYYIGREDQYIITVYYVDEAGTLSPINYAETTSLGNKVPVRVKFNTPCCEFEVPVTFTPPFRSPTPEAVILFKENPEYQKQVDESTSYYAGGGTPLTTPNDNNWINPNPNYLLDVDKNFDYEELADGSTQLINPNAYPLDFEGYAISMLYECKSTQNPGYSREEAAQEIYGKLRGWHRPGLFNQMVYHMATDNYGNKDCERNSFGTPPDNPVNGNYATCDFGKVPEKIPGAQYAMQELADCWEPLVIELVNQLCVEQYELNENADDTVAENYDTRGGNSKKHLKDNIGWLLRWRAKKVIRKMRRMRVSGNGGTATEEAIDQKSLATQFLNCTGYAFADIIDIPNETLGEVREANFPDFQSDFDRRVNSKNDQEYTAYDVNRLGTDWSLFTLRPENDGETAASIEQADDQNIGILHKLFPFIKDPVYAFKYYEYQEGLFPILEAETCYRDPNICINIVVDSDTGEITEEEFACCQDAQGNPIPCNFCDVGYIQCPETKDDWSCDQRFTFHDMLKGYRETEVAKQIPINCENYYEATSYVHNPDYDKDPETDTMVLQFRDTSIESGALTGLEYLSVNLFTEYDSANGYIETSLSGLTPVTHFKNLLGEAPGDGVSIVENEARELFEDCDTNCDQRRKEFKDTLIQLFEDRCYVIGDCKIDPNDNVVPEEDIDTLVDEIVAQCKNQCWIDTYACIDQSCRILGAPTRVDRSDPTSTSAYTINVTSVDHGVSGPIVDGFSNRQDQKLVYFDPLTQSTTQTNEDPIIVDLPGSQGLKKYYYNTANYEFISIWDIRQSLTYAQSTRHKQATEWKVELDLPSKCDANGNYNPNLTYTSNNLPIEPVYILDETANVWVQQSFEICTDQADYVSRDNPDGPGDTFVERDQYINPTRAPFDPNDPNTEGVASPKTGINVSINPNN
ncbi:hypothetical protein J8281_11650 [Aquimarina sp. U1-2]|uniref:hypothetical protein n=1 Tax=Aquimarina sp. U1-2 TaxID=2823141 RepID=UPI001AECBFA4|nr:hypothetical protein [Aquimarina sp. U1-2]MBP2832841.1 hypothetical protein [Aquimarina sp. U1-2]